MPHKAACQVEAGMDVNREDLHVGLNDISKRLFVL
jgi:hypothetical protein